MSRAGGWVTVGRVVPGTSSYRQQADQAASPPSLAPGPDGWPIVWIDLATGVRTLVFSGAEEDRPVACDWPAGPAWATTMDWIG
jgi:hypothetical protein